MITCFRTYSLRKDVSRKYLRIKKKEIRQDGIHKRIFLLLRVASLSASINNKWFAVKHKQLMYIVLNFVVTYLTVIK